MLLADGAEFFELNQIDPTSVDRHLEKCAPCKQEVETEKILHTYIQNLLRETCCEKAPIDLINSIHEQLNFASQNQRTCGFIMKQVSIEVSDTGQITQTEFHIESTQQFPFQQD